MGQAGAIQIPFMVDENLGLVLQPPESRAMNDAITIALKFAAVAGRRFGIPSAATALRISRIGRAGDRCSKLAHRSLAYWASVRVRAASSKSSLMTAWPRDFNSIRRKRPSMDFLSTELSSRKRCGLMCG